jgi:predicted ATPase/DNA-binding CsgD family transcriptional regulator
MKSEVLRVSLPRSLDTLVGRESDLEAAYAQMLEGDERLLTITGPGGVGKTRFALELGARLEERYLHGALFVECVTLNAVTDLARQVLLAIGEMPSVKPDDQLERMLYQKHMLLILDNLEQLQGVGKWLEGLLQTCRDLTVVATSRHTLRVPFERRYPLSPLECPPVEINTSLEVIRSSEAVKLLLRRTRQVNPRFELQAQEWFLVADLVGQLDGLPLAIELAAGQLAYFPLGNLLDRLKAGIDLPRSSERKGRQRSLEDNLVWGFELLEPNQQTLLLYLGLLEGNFDREIIQAFPLEDTDLIFNNLLERAWVNRSNDQYRLLETVRGFALKLARQEHLEASGRAMLLDWLITNVLRHAQNSTGPLEPQIERIVQHLWLHLRVALRWELDQGRSTLVVKTLDAIWIWGMNSVNALEILKMVEQGLPHAELSPEEQLNVLLHFIQGTHHLGYNDLAVRAWELLEARVQGMALSSKQQTRLERIRGMMHSALGQISAALAANERGLKAAQAGGHPQQIAMMHLEVSRRNFRLHRYQQARVHLESAMKLCSEQDVFLFNTLLEEMAEVCFHLGEPELARNYVHSALEIQTRLNMSMQSLVVPYRMLTEFAFYEGKFEDMRQHLEAALACDPERHQMFSSLNLAWRGWLFLHEQSHTQARGDFVDALRDAATEQILDIVWLSLLGLCQSEAQQHHLSEAARLFGSLDTLMQNHETLGYFREHAYWKPVLQKLEILVQTDFATQREEGQNLGHLKLLERYGLFLNQRKGQVGYQAQPNLEDQKLVKSSSLTRLSLRETQVLSLLATGQTNKRIASQLELSPSTVDTHLKRIFIKLECKTRAQAVSRATELGWV